MLEVSIDFFNCLITSVLGFYIIKKIVGSSVKICSYKTLILLCIESIITTYVQNINYMGLHTLIIFVINIIIYKEIFDISINDSIIATVLLNLIIFVIDVLISSLLHPFLTVAKIREEGLMYLLVNSIICVLSINLFKIKVINKKLHQFYQNISQEHKISNSMFFLLIIILICVLVYNLYKNIGLKNDYIINLGIIFIILLLTSLFINNKNEYKKLSNEYDSLFTYIQNFEEWIEKEQLNRHEYKNQLAVIRCLTKEKKVKNKIDEILEDNINIEDQAVTNLKNLPKGGIKGLMYYKAAIAQKQKIHLTTDVSINEKGLLSKLPEKDIRVLCKLIGIYFDNAIEAAAESRKKNLTIEVYELKDKVNFVFSNTFKNHKNMKDRNSKGVSSKGEGRGNGLYFAGKLIKENSWLEGKQEIIDNYYIQQLAIKKDIIKDIFNLQ